MVTGAYSCLFRTGGEEGTSLEAFHNSLNSGLGTGIVAQPGTVAWTENYAKARVLFAASEATRRLACQFDPATMTSFIPRWEKIMGITPNPNATLNERRRVIGAQWKMVGLVPTPQAIEDFIVNIIGNLFVDTLHIPSDQASTFIPGGINIEGGLNIPDGNWSSTISHLPVRVQQPVGMSDSQFYETVNNFSLYLNRFLPAYVNHQWGRYTGQIGTISIPAGQQYVTGTGVNFFGNPSIVKIGEEIEFFDDLNNFQSFKVLQITSATTLVLSGVVPNAVTAKEFRRIGFYLDKRNLDNAFFSPGAFPVPQPPPPVIPPTPDFTPPTVSITGY